MRTTARSIGIVVFLGVGMLRAANSLAAGPYTDELSRCLVRSTTDADKTLLVQWMFAMASLHPAVKSMSVMSDAERTKITRDIAGIMEHLLTVSCKSEAQQAVRYEGNGALEASFGVLGQVAGRELFSNPQVAAGLAELDKFIDADKLKKALKADK